MQTLELLTKRIHTTQDLKSIVRTMKTLSAVSIRQYEAAVVSLRTYNRTIELGLQVLLQQRVAPPTLRRRELGRPVAVIFGSDHGLCGRFNEEITGFAERWLDSRPDLEPGPRVLAVGARAAGLLDAIDRAADELLFLPGAVGGLTETAETILLTVERWREADGVTEVVLFFNRRGEEGLTKPQATTLLPLDAAYLRRLAQRPWPSRRLPTFTMDTERLFAALVRQRLFITVFQAAAESLASEHATRLAAMQAAERNIEETLEDMHADYRRKRQDSITSELLDVVSGFETLRAADTDPTRTP